MGERLGHEPRTPRENPAGAASGAAPVGSSVSLTVLTFAWTT